MIKFTRDRFIGHFQITFGIHCLRMWKRHVKQPPTFIATCLYEWIKTNSGEVMADADVFVHVVAPVIEQCFIANNGQRPDAEHFTGLVYDALDAAGVAVVITPPRRPHVR